MYVDVHMAVLHNMMNDSTFSGNVFFNDYLIQDMMKKMLDKRISDDWQSVCK